MKFFTKLICLCVVLAHWKVSGDEVHGYHTRSIRSTREEANESDNDKYYWNLVGQKELQRAVNLVQNLNVAKNVILFLGDGMGIPTVTAARIFDGQSRGESGEENFLSFDSFTNVGLSKTYNVDFQVPDSAGTGTAYLTGVKTNKGVIGFDARVERGNCETITNDSVVYSIAKWSQDKGKRTGLVTTTRVTHATPANIYAHTPERDWECDAFIPEEVSEDCPFFKDIARQLVEDDPGRNLNVIMGGGFQYLDASATDLPGDPVLPENCIREDGRNLWQDWLDYREDNGDIARFVRNRNDLLDTDLSTTTHLLGIFANDHLPYEYETRELDLDVPTIAEMTEAAITLLSQEPNGFFLLVEGGKIDWSHHSNLANVALDETVAMHEAVQRAVDLTSEQDTLIVVTADHSHTMTMNGYPERGNPITGTAGDGSDNIAYTTLSYANGPGYNYTIDEDGNVTRDDPSTVNTTAWEHVSLAAVPLDYETHGGEDVAIYARGPMSHLFHTVHEQNFIAHAMAYASCVDEEGAHCKAGSADGHPKYIYIISMVLCIIVFNFVMI